MAELPVLVVDDNHSIQMLLAALLTRGGYVPELANAERGIQRLRASRYHALILDLLRPGDGGYDVLQFIRSEQPEMLPRVVAITAASKVSVHDVPTLRKPFDIAELMAAVDAIPGARE